MLDAQDIAEQFEKHINSPKQTWLIGAGASFGANIPLMQTLTTEVLSAAREKKFKTDSEALGVLKFVEDDVAIGANIEEILTHLGDAIAMADRSRTGAVVFAKKSIKKSKLVEVHLGLLELIADIVRWGFRQKLLDDEGEVVRPEERGTKGNSIIEISMHQDFIRAIFGDSRAGLDIVRSPVEFFTTNYDTLIEDALALERVPFADGFSGGAVGFWSADQYDHDKRAKAVVTKLHGSVDWYRSGIMPSPLLRVREGDLYPRRDGGAVMIYPQATKYLNTQLDPFAELFQRFRHRLAIAKDHVLLICGYSFGDAHINAEIEQAMAAKKSQLTIVAFSDEF